ncbi:MAG: alcohol dehydrogenase [Solirubrobacterales bacterium 70-9]|nr:MAG: alcohol dehydrogenase [Solirubrobacterales bacterium 70-9]
MRIPATDLEVFPLALGGNVFGWTVDEREAFEVLDAFAAAGGNLVDTSDVYWKFKPGNVGGESERIIGAWMRSRGTRERMIVSTKVGAFDGMRGGLTREKVHRYVDDSLGRLGVDRIDLLWAHTDDLDTPMEETLAAFDEVVRAGKARALGASRHQPHRFEAALEIAAREGFARYVAMQPLYSLMERGHELDLLPLAERSGVAVFPFYTLASGFLTGKYRPGAEVDSVRADGPVERARNPTAYLDARGLATLAALDGIAAAHDTSVAAVALAWLRAQPTVAAPIASARTVAQLEGLLPAAEIALSAAEVERLAAVSHEEDPPLTLGVEV